ncbi:MAG: two-component system response regulator [Actinomycetota bacterium]
MTVFDIKKVKVLLIDDEAFIRSTIRQILVQVGVPQANVYEAGNARAGATETLRMRPNMVLCDIHMPDDDGFVYVEHVRKAPIPEVAATPIVMLTSDSTEEAVLTAKQLKVEGYLVKPVSIAAVKKAVERALKVELK